MQGNDLRETSGSRKLLRQSDEGVDSSHRAFHGVLLGEVFPETRLEHLGFVDFDGAEPVDFGSVNVEIIHIGGEIVQGVDGFRR